MSLLVDIKKDFGDFLLDCHFETEEGILGFLGASGSGKSLTLRCIAGIETPDEGQIILNGVTLFDKKRHINLPPQKRRVGYLFQNYGLFPNMTLEQNLLTALHSEKDKKQRKTKVAEMIRQMDLLGLERKNPRELSGGQQQRTALARILLNQPEILLLDEPFSALDAYLRDRLTADLKITLQNFGKQVILVSHSRDEIYRLCDHVSIVSDGKLYGTGAVKQVFASPGTIDGAILTGCKNVIRAEKVSDFEVFVPEWNRSFVTEDYVRQDLVGIGIRAHYFHPNAGNSGEVQLVEQIEEPFEWILKFRYRCADPGSQDLWWRMPKEKKMPVFPEVLGIAPKNIMLLYPQEQEWRR